MTFTRGKLWRVFLGVFFCFTAICTILLIREDKSVETTIKVAYPSYEGAAAYDPVKIHFADSYTFLADTFSPLIEYSVTGELLSAAAERFEWIDTEAHFTMRKGLKTIDGHPIDAYDAELSFKRTFILGGNTHGNLKDMLCPGVKLASLKDSCPGLVVRDNGRTLVMKFKERKVFLFPMLAAIDFAIIPRGSINPETLAITDYRNTSGPYYVLNDFHAERKIVLAANPQHFHYSQDIPQSAELVPTTGMDKMGSLTLFTEGKVDHIMTIDRLPVDTAIKYAKEHNNVELFRTYPVQVSFVIFTSKGLARLTKNERFRIGEDLKRLFLRKHTAGNGYEEAEQIFPLLGEGALGDAEYADIKKERVTAAGGGQVDKPFLAWNINMTPDFAGEEESLKQLFPGGQFVKMGKIPGFVDYRKEKLEEPDCYLMWTDMGFQEDIGLLSYYNGVEFFYWNGQDKAKWLRQYMSITEKKDRLKQLRELHYQTLLNAAVIPIAKSPYTALVRKPWKIGFSKLYGSNRLWRIHH